MFFSSYVTLVYMYVFALPLIAVIKLSTGRNPVLPSFMKDDSCPKIEELGGAFLLGFYGLPHAPAHLRKSGVKFK